MVEAQWGRATEFKTATGQCIQPKTLEIKIIDFGTAEFTENVSKSTAENQVGTPLFLPPEWYSHENAYDPELVTTWALGSILYQLTLGSWNYKDGEHERDREREDFYLSKETKFLINRTLCDFRFRIRIDELCHYLEH